MEENNKINMENAVSAEETVATENAADSVKAETAKKAEKSKSDKKAFFKKLKKIGNKKLKNQALLKKGGYSVVITACVLAAVILLNVLVGVLSSKLGLEIDMTTSKQNSMSEENIEYVKNVDRKVNIIFCGLEDEYVNGTMQYYAYYNHSVNDSNDSSYYKQTVNLVNKYATYNDNITVSFVNTQSSEFTSVSSKYANETLNYGDIIVESTFTSKDGKETERHKIISYDDIYTLSDESGYAAYGYGSYTIGANNIETALTSAISYVCSSETKKLAILIGHSSSDYSASYKTLLEANNYEITVIEDKLITSLSSDYDAVAIISPSKDFVGTELDAISAFLDNDGKLDKGLICFLDASTPTLKNLNDFLLEWGIEVSDGMVFESNDNNHTDGDPYTMGVYPAEDDITSGMTYCITGLNVPILAADPASSDITVTELMTTSDTAVIAPKGSDSGWKNYKDTDKGQFAAVIQAEKKTYNSDSEEIKSYVMAFSSAEFIYSEWAEYEQLSNKNISLAATDRAVSVEDNGISFLSKTITNESFADAVTQSKTVAVCIIFMILLPIITIVTGIVIFIKRKNAR